MIDGLSERASELGKYQSVAHKFSFGCSEMAAKYVAKSSLKSI